MNKNLKLIVSAILFLALWASPVYLAIHFEDPKLMWWFIASFIGSLQLNLGEHE